MRFKEYGQREIMLFTSNFFLSLSLCCSILKEANRI